MILLSGFFTRKLGLFTALISLAFQVTLPILHVLHESETQGTTCEDAGAGLDTISQHLTQLSDLSHHFHDQDHCTLCRAFFHSSSILKSIKPGSSIPRFVFLKFNVVLPSDLPGPLIGFSQARAPPLFS